MVMLLSHEDPDDVVEPMMLTHGMIDGAGGLWSLSVDDGALGDSGALLEMPSRWRCGELLDEFRP